MNYHKRPIDLELFMALREDPESAAGGPQEPQSDPSTPSPLSREGSAPTGAPTAEFPDPDFSPLYGGHDGQLHSDGELGLTPRRSSLRVDLRAGVVDLRGLSAARMYGDPGEYRRVLDMATDAGWGWSTTTLAGVVVVNRIRMAGGRP